MLLILRPPYLLLVSFSKTKKEGNKKVRGEGKGGEEREEEKGGEGSE